jgi:hypothetical protein
MGMTSFPLPFSTPLDSSQRPWLLALLALLIQHLHMASIVKFSGDGKTRPLWEKKRRAGVLIDHSQWTASHGGDDEDGL